MNRVNTERRRFLKTAIFGGAFLLLAQKLGPLLAFSQRHFYHESTFDNLDRQENDREIIFSDKKGNRVLVVEK